MKKLIALCTLALTVSLSYAQDQSSYQQKLRKLFEVSGTEKSFEVAIVQTLDLFKKQYSDIPVDIWERVEVKFLDTSLDDLTAMLVPVYQKYLDETDLNDIILFYESSVGKKYAQHTPSIMQESMLVGQEWGTKIGEQLLQELEEEGY